MASNGNCDLLSIYLSRPLFLNISLARNIINICNYVQACMITYLCIFMRLCFFIFAFRLYQNGRRSVMNVLFHNENHFFFPHNYCIGSLSLANNLSKDSFPRMAHHTTNSNTQTIVKIWILFHEFTIKRSLLEYNVW